MTIGLQGSHTVTTFLKSFLTPPTFLGMFLMFLTQQCLATNHHKNLGRRKGIRVEKERERNSHQESRNSQRLKKKKCEENQLKGMKIEGNNPVFPWINI